MTQAITKTQDILNFLRQLKANNDREWFNEHKAEFLEVKAHFEVLTQNLIDTLGLEDSALHGLKAKDCVFRIYRDVRFSKDKSPYKTHLGAYINQGGRKGQTCGYYLHLEPGASVLVGGIYAPPAPILYEVRDAIYADNEDFKAIIHAPAFKKTFGAMEGDKLKLGPKGFPKDFEDIELLKHKSFLATYNMSDREVSDPDFVANSVAICKLMKPFNDFFNRAILAMNS